MCRSLESGLLALLILGISASPPSAVAEAADPHAVVRGMTISCPRAGQIWGTDQMVGAMAELKRLGVNWITIHPYADIRGDGAVGSAWTAAMYRDTTWLTRPIREAHALGLKIMIKPHLAYWGSPFDWRGAIRFDSDEDWQRFFTTYEAWITRVAELTRDADGFAVGTELDGTVHHEEAWRRIIRSVRRETNAPLTYSASWDTYERVTFWDDLDVIGLQAYFPLVEHENLPSRKELEQAWRRLVRRLEAYAERYGRRIVFGELGYNRSSAAAVRPWEYRQGGEHAEEIQRRCLSAALQALQDSEVIVGAFLWKWFPDENPRARRNFLKSTPAMRSVITDHWGARSTSGS